MTIFRDEVLSRRQHTLNGDVNMALPLSWQICGALLFAMVVMAGLFLSFASYSRIEVVSGTLQPAAGVARVVPSASGTLVKLFVDVGARVRAGAPLAVIRTGLTLSEGEASSQAQLEALRVQEQGLHRQAAQIDAAAGSRAQEIDRKIAGLRAAIASLDRQIGIQENLVQLAGADLDLARRVAVRGFVSKQDVQRREETYSARQQELLRLQRDRDESRHAITEALASKGTALAEAGAQSASLATQQSDIAQHRTQARAQEAYRLTAPVDGRIAVVSARLGDNVSTDKALMLVVPDGSPLRAELTVPSSAIGFLAVGQQVRLAVSAFPYQHFGTVPARIVTIAAAPEVLKSENGEQQSYYPVTARLERNWIPAYGKRQPLITGMTFSARVVTERSTLLKWLLAPLIAVERR
jgi:membrane fusion protein